MNQPNYKPPQPDLNLLRATGLTSEGYPMTLVVLKDFEPLSTNQLKEKISLQHRTKNRTTSFALLDTFQDTITNQKQFSLEINQDFVKHHRSLKISNCKHFTIKSSFHLTSPLSNDKYFIEINDCENFSIEGIKLTSGRNMILISGSSSFAIENCDYSDGEGAGIIIFNGNDFIIKKCNFDNILSAGILVTGNSHNGLIKDCSCTRSRGYYNHDAGIHFCCTSKNITEQHIPEHIHEALSITSKPQRPHHIVIKNCTITNCRAQGIYLEGTINCLIENNTLVNNNKEGICFDWGSSYNIFCHNTVQLNGERRNTSPQEIQADFIFDYPLLKDMSSSMKLPGISLDNGSMNLICENTIKGNYGDGIKMIRSSFFNKIHRNQLTKNAIGANEFVPFYHGITILGLGANQEFSNTPAPLLDFLPSILNTITDNTIKESILAIFSDKQSSNNFIDGNIIFDQEFNRGFLHKTYSRATAFVKRFLRRAFKRLLQKIPPSLFQLFSTWDWRFLKYYPPVIPDDLTLQQWQRSEWGEYKAWINKHSILTSTHWYERYQYALGGHRQIKISIITPVYNTDPQILEECIYSVKIQTSPYWEYILADDGSTNPETLDILRSRLCKDPRIRVIYSEKNSTKGISAATNRGIDAARGDYIVFLDHDDRLAPEAIQSLTEAIEENHDLDILYSDRDMISVEGKRFMHLMKPDWSPENLYAGNYIFHLMCYSLNLLKQLGGLRSEYDGSQDYDLILRAMELDPKVQHIPKVLYHWRQHEKSVALDDDAKNYAFDAGMGALRDALKRRKIVGEVTENKLLWRGNYQVKLPPQPSDRIGFINLPADMAGDQYADTICKNPILRNPPPFLFIQSDVYKAENESNPGILASWVTLSNIGMASGSLFNHKGQFLYAGMTFDETGKIILPYFKYNVSEPGYMAATKATRNICAPNPYSVIISTKLWEELKGFDSSFKGPYALLDLALRALAADWRILFQPSEVFFAHEYNLEGDTLLEQAAFRKKWKQWLLQGDPYYSPNLKKNSPNYELT